MSRSGDRSTSHDGGRRHTTRSRSPHSRAHRPKDTQADEPRHHHHPREYRSRDDSHERHRHHHRRHHRSDADPDKEKRSEHRHKHRHNKPKRASAPPVPDAVVLPSGARALSRSGDYASWRPLFAHYLDIQKQLFLAELDEHEARGRWKSFVGKWNRGELAQGWYDPEMFARVKEMAPEEEEEEEEVGGGRRDDGREKAVSRDDGDRGRRGGQDGTSDNGEDDNDDDDEWGPILPGGSAAPSSSRHGPAIPKAQDLQDRREQLSDERLAQAGALRLARAADRAEQKERLDELLPPRADAGTRERRLEKRAAVNDKMRAFRDGSPGVAGVDDAELMGGGEGGGIEEHKRAVAAQQRRKTEREVRREEEDRARAEEREERMREYREREEATVERLRELAKARFG